MRRFALFFMLALGVGCGPATSATPKKTAGDDQAKARGEEITARTLDVYRNARSYADNATYVEQSTLRGEGVERELPFFQMSLAFRRPNQLRLTFEEAVAGSSGRKGYDIASDGRRLRTAATEIPQQVQESPSPDALTVENLVTDPLVREALFERPISEVFPQLAMLLNRKDEPVFPRDESPRLLGTEMLGGRECYRVASTNPDGTRILWIDSETYLLRRMELPVVAHRRAIDPDNNYLNLRIWIDIQDANIDPVIDATSFAMDVPPQTRRVRRFVRPPQELEDSEEDTEDENASDSSGVKEAREQFARALDEATISDSAE